MKEVTIMVTDKVACHIERLVERGSTRGSREAYEAFCLATSTRPIKGDRWIRVGSHVNSEWARLPKRLSFGS